jgi:hypothetical protein
MSAAQWSYHPAAVAIAHFIISHFPFCHVCNFKVFLFQISISNRSGRASGEKVHPFPSLLCLAHLGHVS